MAYDVFISYRRKGAGAGVAGELQSKLENLGYNVFLDVDEIGSGQFPTQIKHAIEQCKDFLLVLSPGTLDRCVEEDDWVRREITMAQDLNKNIVGVGLPGFIMPEVNALPKPLQPLATRQVFAWTHEYRTASFAKIQENLVSTQLKKKKNRQKTIALVPAVLVVLVAAVFFLFQKPTVESPEASETQMANDFYADAQSFDYHVNRAMALTQIMPDVVEIKKLLSQSALDTNSLNNLMESIAEYDEALRLKEKYGDQIVDNYDVSTKREALLDLRQKYFDAILSDIKVLLEADGAMFAAQDLEMAKVLALPVERPILDSIEAIISAART